MTSLGLLITESIITEYGVKEVLRRLSDPFWFQSLGAVMGMDWHSSGITTSVMGALKKAINSHSKELGIYICGGKGKYSRQTPDELMRIADSTGLNGNELVRCSKLSAKIDNTAIQDGFQLYTHNFVLSKEGDWTVIQQGMKAEDKTARRYHWHSENIQSFIEEPHSGVYGENQGLILNLTAHEAGNTRNKIMEISAENPDKIIPFLHHLKMPVHHEVKAENVNLKRLGSMLWLTHEKEPKDFEELLLLQGMGPRTLQSLALVSEVIHGSPVRFKDPARFSFAHGGKDGHPFPVPVKVYDETIDALKNAVEKSKLGTHDKSTAIKKLQEIATRAEKDFTPNDNFDQFLEKERNESWKYGGRTIYGAAKPPVEEKTVQLSLF